MGHTYSWRQSLSLWDRFAVASVMVTILFYMSPIIYSEATAPAEWIKVVILFNPVSYLVSPFRDACFHGHLAHPAMWAVLPIGSVMVLVFGYGVFRKLKPQFGNAL